MGKYEEALEQAKAGKPLDEVFPELKESEDERIRKKCIELIKRVIPSGNNQSSESKDILDCIAYLEKQKDERKLVFIEGKMEGVRQTCQEIKDAMSLFEPKDLTPFEFTFRDYIDSAIRYCLAGEGYQQYIKEWAADLLNLEKQKEQKTLILDGEIEDRKRDIVAAIRKYYPADYAEYLTSFLKGLSPEDNSDDEYGQEMLGIAYKLMYEYIPKKLRTQEFWDSLKFMREYTGKVAIIHSYEQPAEWSEEYHEEDLRTRFAFYTYKDEDDALYLSNVFVEEASRHKGFGTKILKAAEKVAETIGASRIFLKVKQNTPANDWYRRHGYGYETFEDDYDWLEKRLEYLKPNQEWSEEDEKMFGRLKEILNIADAELCKKLNGEAILIGEGEFNHLKFGIAHCLSWLELRLKSIRPQPHWKPSEEQMDALERAIVKMHTTNDIGILAELRDNLKKL